MIVDAEVLTSDDIDVIVKLASRVAIYGYELRRLKLPDHMITALLIEYQRSLIGAIAKEDTE